MTTGRFRRGNAPSLPAAQRRVPTGEGRFATLLAFSLVVHLVVGLICLQRYAPPRFVPTVPTVYVDLVMPPVTNPQRGSAAAVRPVTAPIASKKPPAAPVKTVKEAVPPPVKEGKKTPAVQETSGVDESIAAMRKRMTEQAEQQSVQAAIAALKQKRAQPAPSPPVAVGSAAGNGDEAGSALEEWLRQALREKWRYSKYQRSGRTVPSAEVEVEFDAQGKLSAYRFIRASQDARFDDSLKRAILSLEALPKPLRKPFKETILFNLDDLQGQ